MYRKRAFFVFLVLIITISSIFSQKLEKGIQVCAQWKPNQWYLGTISSIDGNKVKINYADGDQSTITRSDIKLIDKNYKYNVSDKVFAVWPADSKFYNALIVKLQKNGAIVKWEDGSSNKFISFSKMILIKSASTSKKSKVLSKKAAKKNSQPQPTISSSSTSSTVEYYKIWYKGSKVGEIGSNGKVWVNGSRVGEITSSGKVWKNGSRIGEIESNGNFWLNGSKVGEMENNGNVWKNGSKIGSVEENGNVWYKGSKIGEAPTIPKKHVAAFFFFYFLDEIQ